MPNPKILLVANTAWNLWNYRRNLIQALVDRGYHVSLAAPFDGCESRWPPDSGVRVFPLRRLSRKSLSPLQNLGCLFELRRLFRKEAPDLVLLFTIKPNLLGNLAAQGLSCRTLSFVEGLGYAGSAAASWRWWAAPLYRWALRRASRVIFLNADDEQEFQKLGLVRARQVARIPGPGVDVRYFKAEKRPPGPPVFLFCGRLLVEKGIREFVAAARLVKMQRPEVKFQVVGAPDPGNPNTVSPAELQTWQAEGAVTFLGSVADVRPYLAAADVLALPSYYREGVPRAVLEAMAMGKIILTTDTPGCRDTVSPGENGILVPPRSTEALAAAMLALLQLPKERWGKMGSLSRKKAKEEFSDALVIPQLLHWIRQLAAPE